MNRAVSTAELPEHRRPPMIDVGASIYSIEQAARHGGAIGQHGGGLGDQLENTGIGAIDLQTLTAELNSPSATAGGSGGLQGFMRIVPDPSTTPPPLQLQLRPSGAEHTAGAENSTTPPPLLRIRIPTPPTIAGQADVHAGHLRTPVHYEFAASFAARQIRQLTPSGTIGGSSALLTPRHTTYYPHQLLHHQLNLSRAAGRGEEDTEQQLLDRLFADAPALRPSGGLTPAAIAALERNLTPDEGSCCAICLELLHSFLPEQQSSADPPPHLPSPSPPPQSPQPEVEQAEGGALSASAVAVGSTVKLPCGHEFHDGCVRRWLSSHSTCPVCRHELACS